MAAASTSASASASSSNPFTTAEIEFMAEDELVTIVPRFRFPRLSFLSGSYGPFQPMVAVEVPLWLAIALKQRNSCTIQLPKWMEQEALTRKHEQVQSGQNEKYFNEMPFHYQEVAAILLKSGGDIPNAQDIRVKLEDIKDIREAKLQAGLRDINGEQPAVKLNNVSAMEIHSIRPFLLQSMHVFNTLKKAETEEAMSSLPMYDSAAPFNI